VGQSADGYSSIELRTYISVLRRRWYFVVLSALVCGSSAFLWARRETPLYLASTQLLLSTTSVDASGQVGHDDIVTELQLIESGVVADRARAADAGINAVAASQVGTSQVIAVQAVGATSAVASRSVDAHVHAYLALRAELRLDPTPELTDLEQRSIEITRSVDDLNTQLLVGTAELRSKFGAGARGESPEQLRKRQADFDQARGDLEVRLLPSMQAYRALQASLLQRITDVRASLAKSNPVPTIVSRTVSASPVSPRPMDNARGGLALGFVVGLCGAFMAEALDPTVRNYRDLEYLLADETPVLAALPRTKRRRRKRAPLAIDDPASGEAEVYRYVWLASGARAASDRPPTMLVCGVDQHAGATRVAANLAATAAAQHDMVLIDCQGGPRTVAGFFGLAESPGLWEIVRQDASPLDTTQSVPFVAHLRALTMGHVPQQQVREALGGLPAVIADLNSRGSAVVVNGPPLGDSTLPLVALGMTHVVLVASAGRTSRRAMVRARQSFDDAGLVVVAAILTRAPLLFIRSKALLAPFATLLNDADGPLIEAAGR
jgi:capsular polysaccharide biosynthesis protein